LVVARFAAQNQLSLFLGRGSPLPIRYPAVEPPQMAFWPGTEGELDPAFASATAAIAFAVLLDPELAVDGEVVPEIAVSSVPIPWLIEINCSRLFTCVNWVMY
jgi:hypothetical protein